MEDVNQTLPCYYLYIISLFPFVSFKIELSQIYGKSTMGQVQKNGSKND